MSEILQGGRPNLINTKEIGPGLYHCRQCDGVYTARVHVCGSEENRITANWSRRRTYWQPPQNLPKRSRQVEEPEIVDSQHPYSLLMPPLTMSDYEASAYSGGFGLGYFCINTFGNWVVAAAKMYRDGTVAHVVAQEAKESGTPLPKGCKVPNVLRVDYEVFRQFLVIFEIARTFEHVSQNVAARFVSEWGNVLKMKDWRENPEPINTPPQWRKLVEENNGYLRIFGIPVVVVATDKISLQLKSGDRALQVDGLTRRRRDLDL